MSAPNFRSVKSASGVLLRLARGEAVGLSLAALPLGAAHAYVEDQCS